MAGIRIDGELEEFRNILRNLNNFDYRGLNAVIGETIRSGTKERFRREEDLEGNRWKKSIRAEMTGGQTLSKTASSGLKDSIEWEADDEGVAVGTNKEYARIHQEGGRFTIRAKSSKGLWFKIRDSWIRKREVTIDMPKREFLGVSDEDMDEIKAIIDEKIQEHVER